MAITYVFGTKGDTEILKTKSDSHTALSGFCVISRKYPDQTLTDSFRIVSKYRRAEDVAGNCYDWYIIDKHFRTSDKSEALKSDYNYKIGKTEDAILEEDTYMDKRLSAVEDAICELDEQINGG